MSLDLPSPHQGSAIAGGRPHAIARRSKVRAIALSRANALSWANKGAFSTWDEGDDLPALAMIVPLGMLVLWTIWEIVGRF